MLRFFLNYWKAVLARLSFRYLVCRRGLGGGGVVGR